MGYPKHYQKNCIIYDKDLWNDLKPYSVAETDSYFRINYNATEYSIGNINGGALFSIIDSNKPTLLATELEDIWLPAIVSNNSHVKTKEVLLGGVVGNNVLGIEEIVKFSDVKLKNWSIESGSVDLCADWIINTNLSSYDVEYGVLCWYKKNTINTSDRKYLFHQIQNGSRIKPETTLNYKIGSNSYTIPTTDVLIKIDDNTIKLLNKDSSKFISDTAIIDNGSFDFNTSIEHQNLPVAAINNFSSKLFYIVDNLNTIDTSLSNYDLYLSNGEFYSYFLGGKDKYDRQAHSAAKMPSRSYLSPSLYHIYRIIYNSLTIDRIRNIDGLGPVKNLEKLKKLCYILSTSPLIDRVNINLLYNSDIKDIVSTYIQSDSKNNISDEIKELLDVIAKIFKYYKQQSFFLQKQTLSFNYINTKTDLLKALSNKYGCYLKISNTSSTPTKIKYSKKISSGSHGYININIKSCIDKNFDPNTDIFNDMKVELGKLYVETQMDPSLSASGCLVKVGAAINGENGQQISPKIVPLSNMAIRKIPEKLLTVFNKDVKTQIDSIGEIKRIDNLVNISQGELEDELSERISYSWSLVDGPDCVRFSDFNADRTANSRNRTSSDFEPSLYIQQTGLYILQGITSLGSTLKSIENIRLYVHDSNNQYQPNKTVPTLLNYTYPTDAEPKQYRAMCANPRQLAFNKNGLLWFIDSDMFVCDVSYPVFPRDRRLVDQKINMELNIVKPDMVAISDSELLKLKEPADVIITFKPNNTIIKLYRITIENMRDSSQNNSQCKSFYEPKIARQRDKNLNIETGASDFLIINRSPSSVDVLDHELVNNIWKRNKVLKFELPEVSTINSPPVVSYGGYSQSVIENIGVEIPFHTIKVNNQNVSYKKIPNNTYWNTSGAKPTSAESGLMASAPPILSGLLTHNYMGGEDPNIRCHMVNIPATGYTTFSKGYFHPNSGWYSYDATSYNQKGFQIYQNISDTSNPNISAIKKFKTEKYKSYIFEGAGFYDMRSNNTETSGSLDLSINRPILYKSAIQIIPYSGYNIPWSDQDPNYGIRNWNGINFRDQELIDDFVVNKEREGLTEFNCDYTPINIYVLRNNQIMNNLTIEDLEVKINYINIANLKNVIFSLEVYNPELDNILSNTNNNENNKNKIFLSFGNNTDRTTDPESWLSKVGATNINSAPILDFIKKHKETNSITDKPNTRVVYLYNQESLDNLSYHFSLMFSDNFSKKNTFTDENKISVSGVSQYNEPINHDGILSPCISPTGYSEKDSVYFRQMLKNNNIQLLDGSLSQFKKIPLQNTKFILTAHVLGPEESIQSLDNTVSTSYLSGLLSYETKPSSNSITNSICSWSVTVHASKNPKFTTKDYLGFLDYETNNTISTTGYNFIADMSDKEYLIPKVNLNAPYDYIVTNKCDYINNDDLSKPLTYSRIQFPYVAGYIPRFFTLVGALVEIQIIAIQLATGGRGDPIINMLLDIRFQREREELNRYYFKPVYNGTYLGVANKALIQASKDGYNWYRMEAQIFKYDNTAILGKNKYKYIKLHKDIATGFSNFVFNKVTNIDNLINTQDIIYTITTNVSLTGLTLNLPGQPPITFQEYDIVKVSGQTQQSENGIYFVKQDSWIRYNPLSPRSLLRNKIFGNNSITSNNILANKVIIVKGSRAYNLFDENDNIAIMTKPAASTANSDLFYGTISNKALLYLDDGEHTVFTLSQALPNNISEGFISKDLTNSNWIMIYKDHTSYFDDSEFGKWGLSKSQSQKSHINTGLSNEHSVATSEGAIGYGSNYLQPEIYSSIDTSYPNKILDTDTLLNNNNNNKIKFNSIVALQYSDNTIKNISFSDSDDAKQLLTAYPYGYQDAAYNLDSLYDYSIIYASGLSSGPNQTLSFSSGIPLSGTRLENLKKSLKNSLSNNNTDYYFIDLKSDKFKTDITSVSGELSLENDYIRVYPNDILTDAEVNKIFARLLSLNAKSEIAPATNTIDLNTISSIYDLQKFYEGLPTDPSGCFKKGYYTESNRLVYCSGAIAKQKLSSLMEERKQLTDILQSNNVRASGNGIGVLPYSSLELSENIVTKELTIKNKKRNYYILNIDHNQECSLSEDATIKILDKVSYSCSSPVGGIPPYKECDAICGSTDVLSGPDEAIATLGTSSIRYVNERVNTQKTLYETQYPGIVWRNDPLIIEKVFYIACENNIRETLVKVREEYIVPQQNVETRGKVGDIFDLQNNSNIKIKFRNIPRKIKGIDPNYTRYVYDYYGRLGQDIIPPPGGPIYNDFYAWQCIKVKQPSQNDPYPNQQIGEFVEPPDFYKLMNEMIFRGFFGSVDGVENKNTEIMDSKEPHEWIPYEYF